MKKLVITRETLRDLSAAELMNVVGGYPPARESDLSDACLATQGGNNTCDASGCNSC